MMDPRPLRPQPVALMLLLRESASGTEVLLGRKLRGFGVGNIVSPGGKIEPGEHPEDAAVRELYEETSMFVQRRDAQHRANMLFRFPANPRADMDCQVFTATEFSGTPATSEELQPQWYPLQTLPVAQMWQDAQAWLPRIVAGQTFTATVVMAQDNLAVESIDYSFW